MVENIRGATCISDAVIRIKIIVEFYETMKSFCDDCPKHLPHNQNQKVATFVSSTSMLQFPSVVAEFDNIMLLSTHMCNLQKDKILNQLRMCISIRHGYTCILDLTMFINRYIITIFLV